MGLRIFQSIVAIALFVFLLGLLGIGYYSSPPTSNPSEQQTSTEQKPRSESQEKRIVSPTFSQWLFPDAISVFTFWLAISTVGLGIVSYLQLGFLNRQERIAAATANAAQKNAEIAERALTVGQRAFVSVKFQQTANRNIKTGEINLWGFTPVWANAGDTPTREMVNHISIYFPDKELPPDWDFPDFWSSSVPTEKRIATPMGVAPRDSTNSQTLYVPIDKIEAVINGEKFLYFWGWATYNDAFPNTKQHVTRFAVQIIVGGDPRNADKISFIYRFLNRYNCSDEECGHQGYGVNWKPREMVVN